MRPELSFFGKSTINTPAKRVQPATDSGRLQTKIFGPLRNRLRLALERQNPVRALVVHLLKTSRPSAISRFIVPVIVDTVNRMLPAWALTHVSKKARKFFPLRAVVNAATAVVNPFMVFRVAASGFHIAPAVVGPGAVPAVCVTMIQASRNSHFSIEAAAGNGFPGDQAVPINEFLLPAFASAMPVIFARFFCWPFKNSPAPKLFPRKIAVTAHNVLQKVMRNHSKSRLGYICWAPK